MANPKKTQASGFYRRRIGNSVVTTVNDGFLDISFGILRGAGLEEMQGLMRDAFREAAPRLTVNAFVIETDRNTILVDTGGGSTTVYSMGLLLDNLQAAGFSPARFRHRSRDPHPSRPHERTDGSGREGGVPARRGRRP